MSNEAIGLAGTVVILLGFLTNGELSIRIFDMIGAILFIIYGVLIGSISNIVLNAALVIIHVYKLYRLEAKKCQERAEQKNG